MEIEESDSGKYPKLDLYELHRQITGFIIDSDYSFVRTAYLCPGRGSPYHILFEVPLVLIDMKEPYLQFEKVLLDSPCSALGKLREVYMNSEDRTAARLMEEWDWSVEDDKSALFVQPENWVCIFMRPGDERRTKAQVIDKKLRPAQRHRLACRKVAGELWAKDPTITIAEMIYRDEINSLFDGEVYEPRTIRGWVKDRCPDRSPGRRKKP